MNAADLWRNLVEWSAPLRSNTALGALVLLVVYALIGAALSRLWSRGVRALLAHDSEGRIDRLNAGYLSQIGKIFLWVLVATLFAHSVPALSRLATALLASVSIASIVIGLAAQSTLANLVAGISLIFYRPFQIGDRLQLSAPTGIETATVESVNLGYTALWTWDNRRVVLPNAVIAAATTINLTAVDPRVMVSVPLSIGYGASIDRARAIAVELAALHEGVAEVVGCAVVALNASSVDLMLRAWCADAGAAATAKADLLEAIKNRFSVEGVEIPYSYQNVILRQAAPDVATGPAVANQTEGVMR